MKNQMIMFEDVQIRISGTPEAPLFCSADVCAVLGLTQTSRATESLDADELTLLKVTSGGQAREMLHVTESGLYHLIFKSRKEAAKRFRRWVTEEVLPTIRREGRYSMLREAEFLTLPEWLEAQGVDMRSDKTKAKRLLGRAWEAGKLLGYRAPKMQEDSGLVMFPAPVLQLAEDGDLPEAMLRLPDAKRTQIEDLLAAMIPGRGYTLDEIASLAGLTGGEMKVIQDASNLVRQIEGMTWKDHVLTRSTVNRRRIYSLKQEEARP